MAGISAVSSSPPGTIAVLILFVSLSVSRLLVALVVLTFGFCFSIVDFIALVARALAHSPGE